MNFLASCMSDKQRKIIEWYWPLMDSHIAQNMLNSQSLRLRAPYLPHELTILQNLIIGDTKINNMAHLPFDILLFYTT